MEVDKERTTETLTSLKYCEAYLEEEVAMEVDHVPRLHRAVIDPFDVR